MSDFKIETKCIQSGYNPGNGEPRVLPIYQSTTYKYCSSEEVGDLFDLKADGHMYSRISNPTVAEVEKKITDLEGGTGDAVGVTANGSAKEGVVVVIAVNVIIAQNHVSQIAALVGDPQANQSCAVVGDFCSGLAAGDGVEGSLLSIGQGAERFSHVKGLLSYFRRNADVTAKMLTFDYRLSVRIFQ